MFAVIIKRRGKHDLRKLFQIEFRSYEWAIGSRQWNYREEAKSDTKTIEQPNVKSLVERK